MAENKPSSSKSHTNLIKNLDFLKKCSFDVKFDLEGTGYTAVEKIGIGAYGVVCSALHNQSGKKVAIKKITGVFDAPTITKRTFREIKILKHFKHDNIISIREILKPREGPTDFQDIYVVLDLMESDLHQIIYSKQPLTEEHIRYFLYQILRGLKYIHSANVIHRDLKPKNLLVRENCHLRIGDFGMARGISSSQSDNENYFLTLYVATRWYRAPEIMFSLLDYSSAMDMWSVGCIFAEMLGRKHLFPGKYYIEQAQLIIDVLGSPSEKFLSACKSDIIKTFIKQMEKKNPVPWSTLYPKASRRALDLLGKMLVLTPSDRVTVEQALRHPYFTGYHDQDDEPICVPAFNFDFEKQDTTVAQFREAIYDEIIEFHEQKNPVLNFNPVLRPAPKTNENVKNSLDDSSSLRPSSLSSSLEITEQGAALQAYVKQLRERFKSSSTADKIKHSLQAGGKENQQLSITCHYLSKEADSDSTSNSTSGKSSISCKSLLSVSTLSDDVEMLSAKSTELKMDSTSSLPKTPASQTQDSQGSGSDNQTISADTKELIKAALRNATLKKRGENEVKDDGRPRPVTAAQRQREREDKRRKRRERALKRMKDKKDADTEEQLSDADKELLERWKNMQTQKSTSQLIKNVTNSNNATPSSSLTLCAEQEPLPVLLGSTQQQAPCNGSSNQPLILCHSSATHVLPLSHHVTGVTQVASTSNLQLQAESSNSVNSSSETSLTPSTSCNTNNPQTTALFDLLNVTNDANSQTNAQQAFNTLDVSSLHLLGLLNLQNNQQVGMLDPNYLPAQSTLNHLRPAATSSSHHAMTTPAQGMCISERVLMPSNSTDSNNHTHDTSVLSKSLSSTPPQSTLLPSTHNNNNTAITTTTVTVTTATTSSAVSSALFVQTDIPLSTASVEDGFPNVMKWKNLSFDRSSSNENSISSNNVFEIIDKNQKQIYTMSSEASSLTSSSVRTAGNLMSNSPETNFPNGSFQNQLSPLPTIQVSCIEEDKRNGLQEKSLVTQQGEGSSDLISALSKQLSKYQVEDSVPPALALTPKGTGNGYGVGLDLDAFMAENLSDKNDCNKFLSPLSSSLLANWMDVTANMDIQGLEKELELSMLSPMALSYTDLRLYSS